MIRAEEGQIIIDGKDILKCDENEILEIRKKIGMVFQSSALFDSLSVWENVGFYLLYHSELEEEEMSKLVTSIILRNPKVKNKRIIGDIFLIKFFNKLEDARELSAIINACSRLGESETAIQFCMESLKVKKRAELMHTKYKQFIISGLKYVSNAEKIEGNGFIIINAKEKIKDTIVGTIASILSNSSIYEEGTIITTMAYYEDKIKVSSRIAGKNGRNIREILTLSLIHI